MEDLARAARKRLKQIYCYGSTPSRRNRLVEFRLITRASEITDYEEFIMCKSLSYKDNKALKKTRARAQRARRDCALYGSGHLDRSNIFHSLLTQVF